MDLMIDNRQSKVKFEDDMIELMKKAVSLCLRMENKLNTHIEVSISFVDNEEIQKLNKTYRKKDSVTDVLSFPQYENGPVYCLGDMVISLEKAKEQASEYGHSFIREVIYLTVHSMLHLMGYDHDNSENTTVMRQKEEVIMKEMGILR